MYGQGQEEDIDQNYLSSELLAQQETGDDPEIARYTLEMEELSEDEVAGQDEIWDTYEHPFFVMDGLIYEEVTVQGDFPRLSPIIMAGVIVEGELLLPLNELFSILNIKGELNVEGDTLEGYFIDEDRPYLIAAPKNTITLEEDTFEIDERDMINTRRDIFLHARIIEEIFGIKSDFNIRRMNVEFEFEDEMPYQKKMRLERQREEFMDIEEGLPEADRDYGRTRSLLNFGTLDWSFYATQTTDQNNRGNVRLSPGFEILGGSFSGNFFYDTDREFTQRNQSYTWDWVNNETSLIKQLTLGKDRFNSFSSLRGDVVGASITNSPTYRQDHYSTRVISDYTEPNWTVEVYRNNRLYDYQDTDESGYYEFEIPISYGTNNIELRYYGPHGESKIRELDINIPYQFAPEGEFEYEATAGVAPNSTYRQPADGDLPIFGKFNTNYGLSQSISVGAGFEYFSAFEEHPFMPHGNLNVALTSDLQFNARHIHDVKSSLTANYRSPHGYRIQGNFRDFSEDQQAFVSSFDQEREVSFSLPFTIGTNSHSLQIQYNQRFYQEYSFNNSSLRYRFSLGGVRISYNHRLRWRESINDIQNSNGIVSLSYSLPNQWRIDSRNSFNYSRNELVSTSFGLNKSFERSSLGVSAGRTFSHGQNRASVSFSYNLDYANVSASANMVDDLFRINQGASGGMVADGFEHAQFSDRGQTDRAGIKLVPFLDIDGDGVKRPDDPSINDLEVSIRRGDIRKDERDSVIRITNLQPYENYFLELDLALSADISWRVKDETINVTTDNNGLKEIYVPVEVMGEVTGRVTREGEDGEITGQERISIKFENAETGEVHDEVTTEVGGQYHFFGLPAGEYYVYPDPDQMTRLDLRNETEKRKVKLEKGIRGDYIQNIDFHLIPDTYN